MCDQWPLLGPGVWMLRTFIQSISFLLCPQRGDGPYALVLVPTREVSSSRAVVSGIRGFVSGVTVLTVPALV